MPNKNGSIFLLTLTCMTVLFILGFSLTFFTGSEDYSSAMSYESEVAFNLAEGAIEEFVARLKNSLNHDDENNQLYKVLRSADIDVTKEIPLEASQVAKLTAYTRETARQIYGIQFGRGLVDSKDFLVDAVIKLQHINPVEASNGDQVLYKYNPDKKEKQGELEVRARVTYRGHTAKISLKFLIRVVKTFVPPFNYFTLFVKDGSVYGGSHFNHRISHSGLQESLEPVDGKPLVGLLRLDHGWNAIRKDFNALNNASSWETDLAQFGNSALTPPGRVYLGQDLNSLMQAGPAVLIRSTNGGKLLFGPNVDPNDRNARQVNGQENFFLRFDVPWYGMKDYVKDFMELQGQKKTKDGFLWTTGWGNKHKIRLFNLGAGEELTSIVTDGPPSFINCFQSYKTHTQEMVNQTPGAPNSSEAMMKARLMAPIDRSGFDVFGNMPPIPGSTLAPDGPADATKLSPTLVYGPAMRQYFRAVQIHPDGVDKPLELPFIATDGPIVSAMNVKGNVELNATQARDLFVNSGVPESFADRLYQNWDKMPDGLKELDKYGNFMSDSGVELYNRGLTNFLQRARGETKEYSGPLKDAMGGFLENFPYPYDKIPSGMEGVIQGTPMREFYEGALWHALPDPYSSYLLDFYFIPRSTEDFFRGRTTVAIGGTYYDRFEFKYINEVAAYRSGANNQVLELNGILALNDSEPLGLRNLRFRGHSVIYSSPMMGGGKVVINGDLVGVDTDVNNISSSIGNDMITIIAPQIVIKTDDAQASDRCYVEANLISVSEPLMVLGTKPVTIKGTVVTPYLNLEEHFATPKENVIVYNALNGIWRNAMPQLMDKQYVAKIVTGGVGKFDWKYERE